MSTVTDQIIARADQIRKRTDGQASMTHQALDSLIWALRLNATQQENLIDAAAYALVAAERVEVARE